MKRYLASIFILKHKRDVKMDNFKYFKFNFGFKRKQNIFKKDTYILNSMNVILNDFIGLKLSKLQDVIKYNLFHYGFDNRYDMFLYPKKGAGAYSKGRGEVLNDLEEISIHDFGANLNESKMIELKEGEEYTKKQLKKLQKILNKYYTQSKQSIFIESDC
jgi:hypothetical protein